MMTHEVHRAEPDINANPKRRWFQFSLRSLVIVVLVGPPLLACGWSDLRRKMKADGHHLLHCPIDDFADNNPTDGLSYAFSGGRINPPSPTLPAITAAVP
jgi:hypothetical protein